MTVREAGNLIIWIGAIAAALTAIAVVVRVVVLRPLKSWIAEQISERIAPPLQQVQAEVATPDGDTLSDTVIRIERGLVTLAARFDDHLTHYHGSIR